MQFVSDFILCLQQSNKQSCNETVVKLYVTAVVLVAATPTQNQSMKSGNHIAFLSIKGIKFSITNAEQHSLFIKYSTPVVF